MFEQRKYSRQELCEYFNTDRLDAIKAKLDRQGYAYKTEGRGKQLVLEILGQSKQQALKVYCVEQLGFECNVDEKKLRAFLNNALTNEGFINLQLNEMREQLESQGICICEKTLAKYQKKIEQLGWITRKPLDFIYYVYDKKKQHNTYITREEYNSLYQTYWNTVREDKGFDRAEREILDKYGSKPKKRYKQVINGLYCKEYNRVLELL